jgi:hypothetical protein
MPFRQVGGQIWQPAHLRLELKAIDWFHYESHCRCGGTTPQFLDLRKHECGWRNDARRLRGHWNWADTVLSISDAPAVWSHCADRATVCLATHIMTRRNVQGYVWGARSIQVFWDVNASRRFERLPCLHVSVSSSPSPRTTAVPKVHTSSPNSTTLRHSFQLMLYVLFQT